MKFLTWLKSIGSRKEEIRKDSSIRRETVQIRKKEPTPQKETKQQDYPHKRRFKRYVVEGMDIKAKMVSAEIIELFNVSTGGACIITTKTVKPGDNIVIRITDENINRPLKCTIIWEKEEDDDKKGRLGIFHKAGVQFNGVTPETLIQLKDYMRGSGVPDDKKLEDTYKPSALRFKMYQNEKAVMSFPTSYPVKKISLGGMLVEADRAFQVEQRYPMAVYLPEDKDPIKFQGRIASQLPTKNNQMHNYDIGIEFLNLAAQDKSRLNKFLALL